jgi:hypothetical protein
MRPATTNPLPHKQQRDKEIKSRGNTSFQPGSVDEIRSASRFVSLHIATNSSGPMTVSSSRQSSVKLFTSGHKRGRTPGLDNTGLAKGDPPARRAAHVACPDLGDCHHIDLCLHVLRYHSCHMHNANHLEPVDNSKGIIGSTKRTFKVKWSLGVHTLQHEYRRQHKDFKVKL